MVESPNGWETTVDDEEPQMEMGSPMGGEAPMDKEK